MSFNTYPRRRVRLAVEVLEARELLSIAANFDFTMLERTTADSNGRIVIPNTAAHANPLAGFPVKFFSTSVSSSTITSFRWTITGSTGAVSIKPADNGKSTLTLPLLEGDYVVGLDATSTFRRGKFVITQTNHRDNPVRIDDILVVAMGDSYGAGEGNPEVPSAVEADVQWAQGGTPTITTGHKNNHRSSSAHSAQVALSLEQGDPHTSVTYVTKAQTGAQIVNLTEFGGQIDGVKAIVGNRSIDLLGLSIGGNNAGFVKIIEQLLVHGIGLRTPLGTVGVLPDPVLSLFPQATRVSLARSLDEIKEEVRLALQDVTPNYLFLDQTILSILNVRPSQIFIEEYPDPTRDENGDTATLGDDLLPQDAQNLASTFAELGGLLTAIPVGLLNSVLDTVVIDKEEADFTRDFIIKPLNDLILAKANQFGWNYVRGVADAFRTHGYGSTDSWIRHIPDSFAMEGSINGAFHPTAEGQAAMATQMLGETLPLARITLPAGTIKAGRPVVLSAAQSVSHIGAMQKFEWDFQPPLGLPVFLATDATGVQATFTPEASGAHTVVLRVTDGANRSTFTSVTFNVAPPAPPGTSLEGGILFVDGSSFADTIHLVPFLKRPSGSGSQIFLNFVPSVRVTQTGRPDAEFRLAGLSKIVVNGFGGKDQIFVDGTFNANIVAIVGRPNTPIPVEVYGGTDDDTLTGGNGDELLSGDGGADILNGRGGMDRILGGRGNDTAVADSLDTLDLGPDEDGILLRGTNGNDRITITWQLFQNTSLAIVTINGRTQAIPYANGQTIFVDGLGGDDVIVMDPTAGSRWRANFKGGAGNDVLIGSAAADVLDGGNGADLIFAQGGLDQIAADELDRVRQGFVLIPEKFLKRR